MNVTNHVSQTPAARNLLEEHQRLAEINHMDATHAVEDYRRSLEQRDGLPIEVHWEPKPPGGFGTVTCAWLEVPPADHHLLQLTASVPELAKPAVLAHELTHLDIDGQAKTVGKLRKIGVTVENEKTMMAALAPHVRALRWKTFGSEKQIKNCGVDLLMRFISGVQNNSLDMIVETKIKHLMPILASAQYLSSRFAVQRRRDAEGWKLWPDLLPRNLYRGLRASSASYFLFFDALFDNVTDDFAPDRNTFYEELAEALVDRFERAFPKLGPGDDYEFVDSVATMVGIREFYSWLPIAPMEVKSNREAQPREACGELAFS